VYQPEIHIKKCAVPLPSCRCHRYCAIVPVESRLRHRALQLFSCPWLRACANVPVPGPSSCLCHRINVHRRCLSRLADRSIRRRSGRQSMYLLGHTSQHVPCPCHCADAIGPVHRAHQNMPATSCPCNCSHARGCAIVPVPMCLRQGHRDCAIVPAPFARTIVPPAPSRPGHCSITSDTHAVNIASVTYPLMLQPRWCRYRLY
jgi:hypothetical protein